MLTENQTNELKSALIADRDRILTTAQSAKAFSRDRDKSRIGSDSIDVSAAEVLFGTKLRLADRESYLLNKISHALKRIESSEYGLCEDCAEPIAWQRLKARPVTVLCVDCQEDRETPRADPF